jgi:hypothetical protein
MEIKITIKIDRQVIEDVFVTALEGGSNYWYYLSDESVFIIRAVVPKSEEYSLSSAMAKAILDHEISVPIYDVEDEEEMIGEISLATMEDRLQKMYDDGYHETLKEHINGGGDADTADIIMQYLTMGDVVYG